MSFHEVQFPTNISYGSTGGPGYNTAIIELDSGQEQRVARWSDARRRYNAAKGIQTMDDLVTVINFYIARSGAAYGFRWKDWSDYKSTTLPSGTITRNDQVLGTGDGATTQFQLRKAYTSGAITKYRTITKPVSNTIQVALDGVAQVAGWTLDTTTGVLTFTVAPSVGVSVTAGFEFDVPVRFAKEADELLNLQLDFFDSGSIPTIPLVEIMDSGATEDEFFYGGSYDILLAANATLSIANGRYQSINAQVASLQVNLPDPAALGPGGPYLLIHNSGATHSIRINNHSGVQLIAALAVGTSAEAWLGVDGVGTKFWITR